MMVEGGCELRCEWLIRSFYLGLREGCLLCLRDHDRNDGLFERYWEGCWGVVCYGKVLGLLMLLWWWCCC